MCVRSTTVLVLSLSILYKSFPPNLKVQLTYYCIGRYLQKDVLIWQKICHHRELEFMIPVNLYHTLHKWCIWNPLPTRVAHFAWIRRKTAQSWSLLVFNWKKFNKWSPLTFHMMCSLVQIKQTFPITSYFCNIMDTMCNSFSYLLKLKLIFSLDTTSSNDFYSQTKMHIRFSTRNLHFISIRQKQMLFLIE